MSKRAASSHPTSVRAHCVVIPLMRICYEHDRRAASQALDYAFTLTDASLEDVRRFARARGERLVQRLDQTCTIVGINALREASTANPHHNGVGHRCEIRLSGKLRWRTVPLMWESDSLVIGTRVNLSGGGHQHRCRECGVTVYTQHPYPDDIAAVCEQCGARLTLNLATPNTHAKRHKATQHNP